MSSLGMSALGKAVLGYVKQLYVFKYFNVNASSDESIFSQMNLELTVEFLRFEAGLIEQSAELQSAPILLEVYTRSVLEE